MVIMIIVLLLVFLLLLGLKCWNRKSSLTEIVPVCLSGPVPQEPSGGAADQPGLQAAGLQRHFLPLPHPAPHWGEPAEEQPDLHRVRAWGLDQAVPHWQQGELWLPETTLQLQWGRSHQWLQAFVWPTRVRGLWKSALRPRTVKWSQAFLWFLPSKEEPGDTTVQGGVCKETDGHAAQERVPTGPSHHPIRRGWGVFGGCVAHAVF